MPTENEFKFVLKLDADRRMSFNGQLLFLDQGYLSETGSTRVRRIWANYPDGARVDCYFTYKQWCNNRLIEIETKIDTADYNDLWEMTTRRLCKARLIPSGYDNWCIDFFNRWGTGEYNDRYFVMAEVELPEAETPTELPNFITDNLIYAVPQSDNRFTSSKLFDRHYATDLLRTLTNGNSNS